MICTQSPGHVCVVSDPGVAKQVGQPLWHQDSDLLHRAPQLEDANVQTRLGPLSTVPVEGQLLLGNKEKCTRSVFRPQGEIMSHVGVSINRNLK